MMKKKRSMIFAALSVILAGYAEAQETPSDQKNRDAESEKAQALDTHREGSEQAAEDQDKQAANASELIDEQTNAKVIELLNKVESLMEKRRTDSKMAIPVEIPLRFKPKSLKQSSKQPKKSPKAVIDRIAKKAWVPCLK